MNDLEKLINQRDVLLVDTYILKNIENNVKEGMNNSDAIVKAYEKFHEYAQSIIN